LALFMHGREANWSTVEEGTSGIFGSVFTAIGRLIAYGGVHMKVWVSLDSAEQFTFLQLLCVLLCLVLGKWT
jgi:hypothetical protein